MKLTKIIGLVAIVALVSVLGLVGCGGSNNSAPETSPKPAQASAKPKSVEESGGLIVGFDAEFPPYGFVGNDGSFTGFDLDLAKAVCDKLGWRFKCEPIDWEAKDALLNSGSINCIWNGFTMEGREDKYAFSEPYMLNEQVFVVKKGSPIKGFDGLSGKTVMTQTESAALDILSDPEGKKSLTDTFSSLQTIGDYNNAFMQLTSGMVDAVACDLSVAKYQTSANPDNYEILDESIISEHFAVGFSKNDEQAAEKVTEALKDLNKDGTVEKLIKKYADYGMAYSNWLL